MSRSLKDSIKSYAESLFHRISLLEHHRDLAVACPFFLFDSVNICEAVTCWFIARTNS